MKYLIAAQKLLHKNAQLEKHYFTGKWVPEVPSENLKSIPVIGIRLSDAEAFDTWEDAYEVREAIVEATRDMHNIEIAKRIEGTQFRIYGVKDKELFEARLVGT